MRRFVAGVGSEDSRFRRVHRRGLSLHIGVGLNVFLKKQAVAFLDAIAFLDENVGNTANALGLDIRIGGRLNLSGGSDERNQGVLFRDFGGLNSGDTLVCLIHAVEDNSSPDRNYGGSNRHLLPRLHDLVSFSGLEQPFAVSLLRTRARRV